MSKYICFCGGEIIAIDKKSCKCSNGCFFPYNTKELLEVGVIRRPN